MGIFDDILNDDLDKYTVYVDYDDEPSTYDNDITNEDYIDDLSEWLKASTKSLRFLKISIVDDNLYILYFAICSDIQVKSMIHYKLNQMIDDYCENDNFKVHVKQFGLNI